MTDLRTAAQQALEALEWHLDRGTWGADIEGVTGALRAALAQQADTTDPGHDVDVLREHVRHLERRIRELHAQQAEPLNLRDPAVQKRLATQWGYVPAEQAGPVQKFKPTPLTQEQMDAPLLRTMVPLTEREIGKLTAMFDARHSVRVGIARAVEKASWEKNHG